MPLLLAVLDREVLLEGVCINVTVRLCDRDPDLLLVSEAVNVTEALSVVVEVRDGEGVALSVTVDDRLRENEAEDVGVAESDTVAERVTVGTADTDVVLLTESLFESVTFAVSELLCRFVHESLADKLIVVDGVRLSDSEEENEYDRD